MEDRSCEPTGANCGQ